MQITSKENCTGCAACYNKCPQKCISMMPDEEGFLYPAIDESVCLKCGICQRCCPVNFVPDVSKGAYAVACENMDDEIRLSSSSGGIFSLLAERTIHDGGVVYGAVFDENFNVVHVEASSEREYSLMRGSKYVQSHIGDAYSRAKKNIDAGVPVMFTGTPCQIAGLRNFIGENPKNLLMVDCICHGIPSEYVWQRYLEFVSEKMCMDRKDIAEVSFRSKKCGGGWNDYSVVVDFRNNISHSTIWYQDLYMKSFLHDLSIRLSCYSCPFKGKDRCSDITLGDFWGLSALPDYNDDNKGTSLLLVHSEKGGKALNNVRAQMHMTDADIDLALKYNPSALEIAKKTKKREKFFRNLNAVPFDQLVDTLTREHIKDALNISKSIIKRLLSK